jgi:hypothetical protein
MSTRRALHEWELGSTHAEFLCADLLEIAGFSLLDPQAPLGGPDGGKDMIARRDGLTWVVGVFFPVTRQTFSKIRKKFETDLRAVQRYEADGFFFCVNQPLTPTQRSKLCQLSDHATDIFHLERLRQLADSPLGYLARMRYLSAPASTEAMISYLESVKQDSDHRLESITRDIHEIKDFLHANLSSPLDAG